MKVYPEEPLITTIPNLYRPMRVWMNLYVLILHTHARCRPILCRIHELLSISFNCTKQGSTQPSLSQSVVVTVKLTSRRLSLIARCKLLIKYWHGSICACGKNSGRFWGPLKVVEFKSDRVNKPPIARYKYVCQFYSLSQAHMVCKLLNIRGSEYIA